MLCGGRVLVGKGDERHITDYDWLWQGLFAQFANDFALPAARHTVFWSEVGQPVKPDGYLEDGQVLTFDDAAFRVIAIPGHSMGSVCLMEENSGVLFCGDGIIGDGFFSGCPQITDFDAYLVSMDAKTVAAVYNKPLIGVNHLIGHIYANNIEDNLEFPLLALVVSGGHTELSIMHNNYEFELLGSTLDDAIGESFDKVARVLGFPYPGGPSIEKAASLGNNTYNLTKPVNDETYNFSYSGLKSQVLNIINNAKMKNIEINKNDLSCSFQTIAVDEIVRKVELACRS